MNLNKSVSLSYFKKRNDGNVFLFIPGGFGIDSKYMKPLSEMLSFGTHIGIDFRYSPELKRYSMWSQKLKAVVKSLGDKYDKVFIIAHSCGAMLYLSSKIKQHNIQGVILISSCLDKDWIKSANKLVLKMPLVKSEIASRKFYELPTNLRLRNLFVTWAPYYFSRNIKDGEAYLRSQKFDSKLFIAGNNYFNSKYKNNDLKYRDYFYIQGKFDMVTPPKLLSKKINRMYLIPGAGHFPWFDAKKAFAETLLRCIHLSGGGT